MLKTFHIERFRGFEDLRLINLRRFNIIAGSNNIGKSSLLEALLLFSGARQAIMPARICADRGIIVLKIEHLYHLFYNQDIHTPMRLSGAFTSKASRDFSLQVKDFSEGALKRYDAPESGITINKELYPALSQHYSLTNPDGTILAEGDLVTLADSDGKFQLQTNTSYHETWPCVYLNSNKKTPEIIHRLFEILRARQEGYLLEAVKKIDPRISGITIIDKSIYVDLGESLRLPLEALGDGMHNVILTLAAMDECRGGGLICIDEIENGLHYTAMKAFWQSIVTFAQAHDIQVVATTHNWEMLQQIAEGLDEPTIEETKFIRLVRRNNGRVITQSLSGPEYVTHVAEGFEIR